MTHPDNLPKLSLEEFYELHTDDIRPLNIKIDVDQFKREIEPYRSKFRQWGTKYTEFPRFGASLYNLTGSLDDEVDPSCWPLDQWIKEHPEQFLWDHDFTKPTELMDLPSLSPLKQIQQYMVRSNLLLWNTTGHFKPHVDMLPQYITHFRLWGVTTNDEGYTLKFGDKHIKGFEPGRIYLIDTIKMHEAYATEDDVFTFFLAVDIKSKELIEQLCI